MVAASARWRACRPRHRSSWASSPTIALLCENPDPTDDEILAYLSGNLCRCSGYVGQLRGIRAFLDEKHGKEVERG